jgi:transposase-like protein
MWHLDEIFIPIRGVPLYLSRAMDQRGVVLDILVQRNAMVLVLRAAFAAC